MSYRRRALAWAWVTTLLVSSVSASAHAADWYVDVDVSASGDGRSWTTAWQQLTDIRWASVRPGDTVWVSGGTYTGRFVIDVHGTPEAPIRIAASREPGHDDMVTLDGRISLLESSWVTLDGSRSDTHAVLNAATTPRVQENIHWRIRQGGGNPAIIGQNIVGVRILWLEIDGSPGTEEYNSGIGMNGTDVANVEIAYNHIHHLGQDGIGGNNNPRLLTDLDIHHNYIHHVGDDGMELTGGARIHHNLVQRTTRQHGHPDCIVVVDDQIEVFSNILGDFNTVPGVFFGLKRAVSQHLWVWNNLIYSPNIQGNDGAIMLATDQTLVDMAPQEWRDIRIFNNTAVGTVSGTSFFNRYAGTYDVTVRDAVIANNLYVDTIGVPLSPKGYASSGVLFTAADVQVRNNVITGTGEYSNKIIYLNDGAPWANAEAFNAALGFVGNTSARPTFLNFAAADFHLAETDVVARGAGANLSELGLEARVDADGRSRPGTGAWDIGAFQFGDSVGERVDGGVMTLDDAGVAASADAGGGASSEDAGMPGAIPDAGLPLRDAGASLDATSDRPTSASSGCSCRTTSATPSTRLGPSVLSILLAVGLVARIRRRRARARDGVRAQARSSG